MKARDNPFSAERTDRIAYRPVGTSFEKLLSRLEQMNYRAAIIGPDGSGKTTLLRDLKILLEEKGFVTKTVFINDTSPFTKDSRKQFFAELKCNEVVLLDGADHLGKFIWRRFKTNVLRSSTGLIITSHKPALLPSLIECSTSQGLFVGIVSQLLNGNSRIDRCLLGQIYDKHNGNIRDCLRQLYDIQTVG